MESYICINGKKAELTEGQMKALGIELPKKSSLDRAKDKKYYFINSHGVVHETKDVCAMADDVLFAKANYCTDKAIMEQRAMWETLSRLLWRFSEQNGGKGNCCIARKEDGSFFAMAGCYSYLEPTFINTKVARRAIEEVIEPFMAKHPNFVW